MKRFYYLAYGSNLNIPQMRHRCPGAKICGTAEIEDYRLLFKGSKTGSYLTIEKAPGYYVPVTVWSVTEADLKNLDIYEGYPTFYYRKNMKVDMSGIGEVSREVTAFVYIMHEERKLGLPTNKYIETCYDGYTAFGFDKDLIDEAIEYSWEELNKGLMFGA